MTIVTQTFPDTAHPYLAGKSIEPIPEGLVPDGFSPGDRNVLENLEPVKLPPTFEEVLGNRIPDNDPRNLFATVVDDEGETIAQVFNSGATFLLRNDAQRVDLQNGPRGISLAQTRLDQLVASTGGNVAYANQSPPGFEAQRFFNELVGTGAR